VVLIRVQPEPFGVGRQVCMPLETEEGCWTISNLTRASSRKLTQPGPREVEEILFVKEYYQLGKMNHGKADCTLTSKPAAAHRRRQMLEWADRGRSRYFEGLAIQEGCVGEMPRAPYTEEHYLVQSTVDFSSVTVGNAAPEALQDLTGPVGPLVPWSLESVLP
jgi:hypothetical protein